MSLVLTDLRCLNSSSAETRLSCFNRALSASADGWYQLSPFGEFPGVIENVGASSKPCVQVMDASSFANVVRSFNAQKTADGSNWRGLLLDKDHLSTMQSGTTEAMGRIMDLAVRGNGEKPEDGLYCKIDFTPPGEKSVTDKVYSFLSLDAHVEYADGSGDNDPKPRVRLSVLNGAALTNKPRLPVRSMNRAGDGPSHEENKQPTSKVSKTGDSVNHKELLCKLLGLPSDASDEQITTAASAHTQEVQNRKSEKAELLQLKNRVKEMEEASLAAEAEEFCEIHAGVITNREQVKDQYVKNKDATIALFGAMKPATGIVLNRKDAKTPRNNASVSNDAKAEERSKYIGDLVTSGRCKNRSDAEMLAITLKPELFSRAG